MAQKIKLLKEPNKSSWAESVRTLREIKYNICELNTNLDSVLQFDYIIKNFSNYIDINGKGSTKKGNQQIIT